MSLLQMSFSGAVLILAVTLIRTAAINRLPKKTFLIMWGIVLIRLLLPFSVPSVYSAYSLIHRNMPANISAMAPTGHGSAAPQWEYAGSASLIQAIGNNESHNSAKQADHPRTGQSGNLPGITATSETPARAFSTLPVIWCIGMILCVSFFTLSYLRSRSEFSASLPIHEPYVEQWLKERPLKRAVSVRQSDRILAPLTYGIFHPVILMPKKTDWADDTQLQYVLLHEYIHICRLDAVTKMLIAFAVCIHWFNPPVWIMYVLFNRDLELACDESVIRQSGTASRSAYANMLINMEAKKSGFMPLCNNFCKNAIEERIRAIMKIKKTSFFTVIFSAGLILGVTAVFATSAAPETDDTKYTIAKLSNRKGTDGTFAGENLILKKEFTEEEYDSLIALRFDSYEDMRVSEFQDKVWTLTDTPQYRNLLERFAQNESLYRLRDSNDNVPGHRLTEVSIDRLQTGRHKAYGPYEFTKGDKISFHLEWQNKDGNLFAAIGKENGSFRGLATSGVNAGYLDKTLEIRETGSYFLFLGIMASEKADIVNLAGIITTDSRYMEPAGSEEEPRFHANGTEEDYRSLLSLKTENYQDMSVASFGKALLDWGNEHFDSYERIEEDLIRDDFQVNLSEDERSFVTITQNLSGIENSRIIRSLKTGRPEEDPALSSGSHTKDIQENGYGAWCSFEYDIRWHIADRETVTVRERDRQVSGAINAIEAFWEETEPDTLLKMTKEDMTEKLNEIAMRYSTPDITVSVDEECVFFENMDERYLSDMELPQ